MTAWLSMSRDERTAAIAEGQLAGMSPEKLAREFKTAPAAIEAHATRFGKPFADDSKGSDGQPPAGTARRPEPSTEGSQVQPIEGGRHVAPSPARAPEPAARVASGGPPAALRHYDGEGWTEARLAALPELLASGMSAAQVAAILGGGLTRNSVLGKVHRDKDRYPVRTRGVPGPRHPRPPRDKDARPTVNRAIAKAKAKANPAPRPPRPRVDLPEPVSKAYTLLTLPAGACKFPSATDDIATMTFCGHPQFNERVYCEYHCRLAYIPNRERERYDRRNGIAA